MSDKRLIAQQMNRFFQIMANQMSLDDETAMEIADLYKPWEPNKTYNADEIVKYGTNTDGETQLYKVIQSHTSQEGHTPDTVPSLFKAIGFTDSGIPVWTQPLSAEDAYMTGDIVSHNGKMWVSDADNNVWEPGVYGWEETTEEG